MQKYKITIKEIVSDEFEVIAEDKETAIELATKKYWNADFVLEPGKLQNTYIKIINPTKDKTKWIEI